jgi:hypothetical protein
MLCAPCHTRGGATQTRTSWRRRKEQEETIEEEEKEAKLSAEGVCIMVSSTAQQGVELRLTVVAALWDKALSFGLPVALGLCKFCLT